MMMRSHAKALADALIRPTGFQLVRPTGRNGFYPMAPTCQISTLPHLFERFFGTRTRGMFVEIGAFDGYSYSNTWGLAERNWDGLLVEPIPEQVLKCRSHHKAHPGVRIIQTAIGAFRGTVSLMSAGELTTANHAQADEYRATAWARRLVTGTSVEVPIATLDSLLEEEQIVPEFDLLVVDVEGYEREVFAGFSLSRWLPRMLIVELADTHPDLSVTAGKDAQLSIEIQSVGYRIVYKDEINTVFVQEQLFTTTYGLT